MNRENDPWEESKDITWDACLTFVLIVVGVLGLAVLAAYLRS